MYSEKFRHVRRSRLIGGTLALLVQLAVIIIVWTSFSPRIFRSGMQGALTALDLRPPAPPVPPRPRRPVRAATGRAALPHIRAHAAPLVAPPVTPLKPLPVPAATTAGNGNQKAAGAALLPGAGSGAGGEGQGTGAGADGNGAESGGREVELIRGHISDADVPAAVRDSLFSGTTRAEVAVGTRGEVIGCRTRRSSGSSLLDDTTCRLIFQRFRFRPALDGQGRARNGTIIYEQEWTVTGQFGEEPAGAD